MTDHEARDLFARSLGAATAAHRGAALDDALRDLGWHEALAADAELAVGSLFELQGSANTTSGALDDVVAHALGLDPGERWAVVHPDVGGWEPPGSEDGGRIAVLGLGSPRLRTAAPIVVAVGRAASVDLVRVDPAGLEFAGVEGMDPGLGLATVSGSLPVGAGVAVGDGGPGAGGGGVFDRWPEAVAAARRALAHELVGASGAMLDLARAHALERVQFGRPIAAFQAVRHRLADTLVAIEGARALCGEAWSDPSPGAARMAKAAAGVAARTAARHCQQVLAGMGFTTEHPFHRYVRRVLVLDELFGPARRLLHGLGEELVTTRRVPPPPPL